MMTFQRSTFPPAAVSHNSSNGYYGFSYVNTEHEQELNNNNTTINNNNMENDGNNMPANVDIGAERCKKRAFGNGDKCDTGGVLDDRGGNDGIYATKRCRFDDDGAAQYCNDFFSLVTTQIGTQSCLMDFDFFNRQPQVAKKQHVVLQKEADVDMMADGESSGANLPINSENILDQQQSQQLQSQQHYQYYQGHLHRANRDVSRCLLSHMI